MLPEHIVLLNMHVKENMRNQSELCHFERNIYVHTHLHIYIHTYLCTCIHACIAWIHNCVTKTVGFGTSHNYTNIRNFYSVKYYKHFIK